MNDPNFLEVEAVSEILHQISLQYEEGSEEHEALRKAAAAMGFQVMRDAREQFEKWYTSLAEEDRVTDKMLSDWIADHPEAKVGDVALLMSMAHVVTAEASGQLRLVGLNYEF